MNRFIASFALLLSSLMSFANAQNAPAPVASVIQPYSEGWRKCDGIKGCVLNCYGEKNVRIAATKASEAARVTYLASGAVEYELSDFNDGVYKVSVGREHNVCWLNGLK